MAHLRQQTHLYALNNTRRIKRLSFKVVDVIDFERINIALFEYKVKISNVTLAYYEHAWSNIGFLSNLAQVQIPVQRN